jgi:hypothetical protein
MVVCYLLLRAGDTRLIDLHKSIHVPSCDGVRGSPFRASFFATVTEGRRRSVKEFLPSGKVLSDVQIRPTDIVGTNSSGGLLIAGGGSPPLTKFSDGDYMPDAWPFSTEVSMGAGIWSVPKLGVILSIPDKHAVGTVFAGVRARHEMWRVPGIFFSRPAISPTYKTILVTNLVEDSWQLSVIRPNSIPYLSKIPIKAKDGKFPKIFEIAILSDEYAVCLVGRADTDPPEPTIESTHNANVSLLNVRTAKLDVIGEVKLDSFRDGYLALVKGNKVVILCSGGVVKVFQLELGGSLVHSSKASFGVYPWL